MRKIHLLLKKEEIDEQKISENKVAVIFDILLATSTIAAALEFGSKAGNSCIRWKRSRANGSKNEG